MAGIDWRPGIGDPTWIGWVTAVAYLIAGWLCVRAGRGARAKSGGLPNESSRTSIMWFIFAGGLLLLGVNKQLDFQTAFIEFGRQIARGEGWYRHRRMGQAIFVMLLGATISGVAFLAVSKQRGFFKTHKLALFGSIFLSAFVFLRAAIFNHVDDDAGMGLGEAQWMAGFELAGIVCFAAAGLRADKT